MILYFSGTGNSAYAAKRIGSAAGDAVTDLFEKIRDDDFSDMDSSNPWVVVVPTYAWRIPRMVQRWLRRVRLTGNRRLYFVMTCGGSIGNAGKYAKKLCREKNMEYGGCMGIVMPENYIALFRAPAREEALKILAQAESALFCAARRIQSGELFPEPKLSLGDRINSGIVNGLFYPVFVHAKKFYWKEGCSSCGKCVSVCPLRNIRLENGRPVWGDACTLCRACICRCPQEAIEYGRHTAGALRYICPREE